MKYLLIDTNAWAIDLLTADSDNQILEALEAWLANEEIQILIPEVIKNEEWVKVRDKYLDELKKYSDAFLKTVKRSDTPLSTLMKVQLANMESKAARITKLMDSGIYYEPSLYVKGEVVDRQRKKLAPFHNKERSTADGLIYFSTIEYLKNNNIDCFYFITKNSKDFFPDGNNLHSDLVINNIKTLLYSQLGLLYYELRSELSHIVKEDLFETYKDYVSQFIIEKPKKLSIIDQLYYTLDRYYDQLPFIPPHILARTFPFKIKNPKYKYTFNSAFSIQSNNKELIDTLKNISIKNENEIEISPESNIAETENYKPKAYEVFRKLNDNLIFSIESFGAGKAVSIELEENRKCDCVRCTFNRFQFYESFNKLNSFSNNAPGETLKHAFIQYQFGNFSFSLKMFFSVYNYAQNHKKYLLGLICLYNLKRLQNFIKNHFLKTDESVSKIFSEIDSMPLNRYLLMCASESPFVIENMRWICENNFYYDAHIKIVEVVEKIRDHYYSQLKGGWSNNSNLKILLGAFAEIDTFLENNFIIYSSYSEFFSLFDKVLEGFLMCHAFNENQGSRLVSFDDYLLLRIISYADANKILKYFHQYNLITLRYKLDEERSNSIETILITLFRDYGQVTKLMNDEIEENGFFFFTRLNRIIQNSFVILAITEFPATTISNIANELLTFLQNEKSIRKTEYKYLAEFIGRKGQFFASSTVEGLLNLSIDNEWMHEEEVFRALKYQIQNHHKNLLIGDNKTYEKIIENFFNRCPKCKSFHHDNILISIYAILADKLKKDLQDKMQQHLQEHPNWQTFYLFAIHDIVNYTDFETYLDNINKSNDEVVRRHWYPYGETYFRTLNELINLCFKFNIDLAEPKFEKFKGISDYYDWLLDMDGFDYSKFNPQWILEYPTDFYLKEIFKSNRLKIFIKEYLKKTKNPLIAEYYIKYS